MIGYLRMEWKRRAKGGVESLAWVSEGWSGCEPMGKPNRRKTFGTRAEPVRFQGSQDVLRELSRRHSGT